MDDSRIIELYWQRNSDAIAASEERYGAYCRAISARILHSPEDVEECVNDTWLRAWNTIPPQRPQSLKLFLGRITRNLSFNRWQEQAAAKRGGQETALVLDELAECLESETDVEDEVLFRELRACIRSFVRSLPEREGGVFARRYFFAEPVAAIARQYGMTENHVMVMLSRTRRKLKKRLSKEGFFHDTK